MARSPSLACTHLCRTKRGTIVSLVVSLLGAMTCLPAPARAADMPVMPLKAPPLLAFDWTGFYVGGHFGYAWGNSNWSEDTIGAPGSSASGSFGLFQPFDAFSNTGSFFEGLQVGYNRMLTDRFVVGAEADVSFPSF